MPVLTVYGIPEESKYFLNSLEEDLKNAVALIAELKLETTDVSCFFPADLKPYRSKEIIVFIDGLYEKPERTMEVRKKLAEGIVRSVWENFVGVNKVECFVRPFNSGNGFAVFP